MFRRTFFILLLAVFTLAFSPSLPAQSTDDPNEGARLAPDPTTPGAMTFSWWGKSGRTYFLQQSDDLLHWNYLPIIEPGVEQIIQWGATSSAPQGFLRLRLSDIPTSDPFNDDFDGDGVSNWDELMQGTDPFSAALDTNGLPLDWEQFYGVPAGSDPNQVMPGKGGMTLAQVFAARMNPYAVSTVGDGIPDAWKLKYGLSVTDPDVGSQDYDGDGLTNAEEYEMGTDPWNPDSDGDGIPDGQDLAPMIPDPAQVENAVVAVPSWEAQQQSPTPDYSQVDYTAVEVRWTRATYGGAVSGIRVEKRNDNCPWTTLATVASGTTKQSDQTLVGGRHYQYRVTAFLDVGSTHIEADPVIVDYEVPLGLKLNVKQSTLSRYKKGWAEFVNPSTPPKRYLIQTDFSTYTSSYSDGGSNWSVIRTDSGQRTGTETWLPGSHSHLVDMSYSYNSNQSSYDATSSTTGVYTANQTSHLLQKSRGRGALRSIDQYQHDNNWTDNWSGLEPAGSWTDVVTFKERFDHDFGAQYQATAGTPKWMGEDFDLSKGTLLWSGTSNWLRDPHRHDETGNSSLHGTGWSNWMFEAHSACNPDGTWSGSGHNHYYGSQGDYGESSGAITSRADSNDYGDPGPWTGGLMQPASPTQQIFHTQGGDAHNTWAQDRTLTLSQEYTTAAFMHDVIADLPDYPDDWTNNFYGWDYYSWGYAGWEGWGYWGTWYPYGTPWYGWWAAGRELAKAEDTFEIAKMKYKFTANPSAPMNMKWYEVFVPEDDPATLEIVTERTWSLTAGQNECTEYEINPATATKNGYYTLVIAPVHLAVAGIGEASKDVPGDVNNPGKVVLVNDGNDTLDAGDTPSYAAGYTRPGGPPDTLSSGDDFTPLQVNWLITDPEKAKIRFTYDGSDPLGLVITPAVVDNSGTVKKAAIYTLPTTGKLRLWLKDGYSVRNGDGVTLRGDYLEPGVEYSLKDLGYDPDTNPYPVSGITLYVEAVKTSDAAADLPVKVEVNPNGSVGYRWTDQLRFTAIKIDPILIKQKGAVSGTPTAGVLIKSGATLEMALNGKVFGQEREYAPYLRWNRYQLKADGSFTGGRLIGGRNIRIEHTPVSGGIFEVSAGLSGNSSRVWYYVRDSDEPYSTSDTSGNNSLHWKGSRECFGVVDADWQANVCHVANANLGNTNYATSINNYPLSAGDDKCNLFVARASAAGGAYVPWINGQYPLIRSYPPTANQWSGMEVVNIPEWSLLGSNTMPQPGFIVARSRSITTTGHTGIVDYDGAWISAGPNTINRGADLRLKNYQPAKLRRYIPH